MTSEQFVLAVHAAMLSATKQIDDIKGISWFGRHHANQCSRRTK